MKNIIFLLFLLILNLELANAQDTTCIYLFYGNGCQHCAKIEPIIENIEMRSLHDFQVRRFEIYDNRSNLILLNKFFDNYGINEDDRGIPAVFIGSNYLIGDKPILENMESVLESNLGAECPNIDGHDITGTTGLTSPLKKLNNLSLITVIGAAFVDSINPCAIAVLLILLGALVISGEKKRALKAGLGFTLSIYISYLLFGFGLFSALQISGLSNLFYKAIGIIAIIIGLANIKDYFWYGGGGFVMEIPRNWRPALKKMISGVTSPFGAFLAGFAVCLFELPCTGGPYIVILGLLAERMTLASSIPLLLIYNLVFILPLIILTILIYLGFSNVEKANEWKERNLKMLHLIAGVVMLALGLLIAFGLV